MKKKCCKGHGKFICHTCTLVVIPFMLFLLYFTITVAFLHHLSYEFDPNGHLSVVVGDCSVNISAYEGTTGSLEITRNWRVSLLEIISSYDDTTNTEYVDQVSLAGKDSCLGYFQRKCELICFIQVFVPQNNSLVVTVSQSQGNIEKSFIDVNSVTLQQLDISGESIQVAINNLTTTKETNIETSQRVSISGSRLTNGVISSNLIQMKYLEDSSIDMWNINHRAVTYPYRICIAGANLVEKNTSDTISECLALYQEDIANVYDPEGSRRVTREKITSGLNDAGKCCGSKCPRKSSCEVVADQIIPFGSSYLTLEDFITSLNSSATDYTLIPECMQLTTIQPHTSNPVVIEEDLFLTSVEGGIQVVVEKNYNSTLMSEAQYTNGRRVLNLPPVLTASSYKEIASSITSIYETGLPYMNPAYAIFYLGYNVFAGKMYATYEKYLYTDRSFYVSISPALLNALTMGLATPEVIIQEPLIVADGCTTGPYDSSILSTGGALIDGLRATSSSILRGDLVHLTHETSKSMPFRKMQTITVSITGEPIVKNFMHQSTTIAASILGLCIAAVSSFLILYKFDTVMAIQFERAAEAHRVHKNVMEMSNLEHRRKSVRIEHVRHVLENPVELVDLFIVDPARRYFTDSLSGFIYSTYNVKIVKQRSRSLWNEGGNLKIIPTQDHTPVYTRLLRDINDMTVNDFMCKYEEYCISRKLDMEEDICIVKQRLFEILGVRVRNWNTERIAGCAFKTSTFNPASVPDIDTTRLDDDLYLFMLYADYDLDISGRSNLFVDLDDMTNLLATDAKSKVVYGARNRFRLFCSEVFRQNRVPDRVVNLPDTETFLSDERLNSFGMKRRMMQVQTIRGLSLNTDDIGSESTFSCKKYVVVFMETVLHIMMLTIVPIAIFCFFLIIETFVATSSYVPETPEQYGITLADFWDWQTLFHNRQFDIDPYLRTMWSLCIATVIACNFNLLIVYTGIMKKDTWLSFFSRLVCRIMFSLVLYVWCAIVIWQCIWIMVCAFVNPQKYLPFGTAVFVFFTIVLTELFKIVQVRRQLRAYTESIYKKIIYHRFRDAIEMMYQVDDSPDIERLDAMVRGTTEQIIDPDSIFDFLNYKSNSPDLEGLSRSEFYLMFEVLQINALPHKQAALFAYCDTTSDESVSRDEFKEAWGWLMDKLAEDLVAKGFGMSNFEIFLYLSMMALIVMGVLAFFLLTLPELSTNDSFDAIVQSSILAGGSQLATRMHTSFNGLSATLKMASEDTEQLEHRVRGKVKAHTQHNIH